MAYSGDDRISLSVRVDVRASLVLAAVASQQQRLRLAVMQRFHKREAFSGKEIHELQMLNMILYSLLLGNFLGAIVGLA